MTSQNEKINFIIQLLNEHNIFSLKDVLKLNTRNGSLLYSEDYPWIGHICQVINGFYDEMETYIEDTTGQLFLVDQMTDDNHDNILKYSCVFPQRMIVSAGKLFYLDDPEHAFVDIQFFNKLFWGRKLFEKNLIQITPFYRYTELVPGEGNPDNCLIEYLTLPEENKKKIAELDSCGNGYFGESIQREYIYLLMPWLQNADINTYLEIIEKNRTEFEAYNLKLESLSRNTNNTEQFLKNFEYEIKEANINISIELEKKQKELKAHGIYTFITAALTVIPYLLPDDCLPYQDVMPGVFGSTNLIQITKDIRQFFQLKDVGRGNPFWVLWKWKRKSS